MRAEAEAARDVLQVCSRSSCQTQHSHNSIVLSLLPTPLLSPLLLPYLLIGYVWDLSGEQRVPLVRIHASSHEDHSQVAGTRRQQVFLSFSFSLFFSFYSSPPTLLLLLLFTSRLCYSSLFCSFFLMILFKEQI